MDERRHLNDSYSDVSSELLAEQHFVCRLVLMSSELGTGNDGACTQGTVYCIKREKCVERLLRAQSAIRIFYCA